MQKEGPILYILRAAIGLEQAAQNSHLTDIHGMHVSTETGAARGPLKVNREDEPLCGQA